MVRTQVNMQDENDLKNAREAQDKIELVQASQGVYAQEKEFNRDEILSLRAEYNQRRQPEGITSEMIFGKNKSEEDEEEGEEGNVSMTLFVHHNTAKVDENGSD